MQSVNFTHRELLIDPYIEKTRQEQNQGNFSGEVNKRPCRTMHAVAALNILLSEIFSLNYCNTIYDLQ